MSKLEGPLNKSTRRHFIWTFAFWRTEWGWEHSTVMLKDEQGLRTIPYLERWIVYLGRITLRLHKFHQPDDDRAPHDHPWWFITIPLHAYREIVCMPNGGRYRNEVMPLRPHFRPALYRHIVVGPIPVWTIVISGSVQRRWGFWKTPTEFVPYEIWND